MSEEEAVSEPSSGEKENKLEDEVGEQEHGEEELLDVVIGPAQDSEDEHFVEAQSERPEEEAPTGIKEKEEEDKKYIVILDEEENKEVTEPEVVQERVVRKQPEEQAPTKNENDYLSKEAPDGYSCLTNGTSQASPNEFSLGLEPSSRVVSNAIPSMNSHANDRFGAVINELTALTTKDNETHNAQTAQTAVFQRRSNPPQRSIYHRNPSEQKVAVPNWYVPPEKPITNIIPAPPTYEVPVQHGYRTNDIGQHIPVSSPTRKISNTTPYVGSHVIASETGPSLTVFLRRPNSERQWGFSFYGGAEFGCPPFVNKVAKNGLAFQQGIEVGDVIVSICKTLTVGKTHDQLKAEMLRAGNDLDLVLIRKGVDLEKLTQVVPQLFQGAPRSPASTISYGSGEPTPVESSTRARSGQSLTRGRSFRSVKTKSIRILEEQLSGGQNPSSVVATKQHLQGARGMPAGGSVSSYTTAYGQNPNQGYTGRQAVIQPTNFGQVNASTGYAAPYNQQYSAPPNYGTYVPTQYADTGMGVERGPLETRSDYGAGGAGGGAWSGSVSPRGRQTNHSPNHPGQNYAQAGMQSTTASITVPLHGRQAWPTQYM